MFECIISHAEEWIIKIIYVVWCDLISRMLFRALLDRTGSYFSDWTAYQSSVTSPGTALLSILKSGLKSKGDGVSKNAFTSLGQCYCYYPLFNPLKYMLEPENYVHRFLNAVWYSICRVSIIYFSVSESYFLLFRVLFVRKLALVVCFRCRFSQCSTKTPDIIN